MKKIVMAFPSNATKVAFHDDPKVIFFDGDFWGVDQSSKRVILTFEQINGPFDIEKLSSVFDFYAPTFRRWLGGGNNDETTVAVLKNQVVDFVCALKRIEPVVVIFETSICHHVDTTLFDIACELASIQRVYLYLCVVNNRLIPFEVRGKITSKRPLSISINNYKSSADISDFKKSILAALPPKHNLYTSSLQKSFFFAFLFVVYRYTRFSFSAFLRKNLFKNFAPQKIAFNGKGFFDHVSLLLKQKEFVNMYKKDMKLMNFQEKIHKGVSIVFYSHVQPEATTFPEGGAWYNPLTVVKFLKECNVNIDAVYYKEHPENFAYFDSILGERRVGLFRDVNFLNELNSMGVTIINTSQSFPPKFLEENKVLVATITGTIAIERSLMGYKTIVFGEPWYKGLPGTMNYDELRECDISYSNFFEPSEKIKCEAIVFLKNMLDQNCICNAVGIGHGSMGLNSSVNDYVKELKRLMVALM